MVWFGGNRPHNARLTCSGIGTLDLPWWPDTISRSGFAAVWEEIPRPGREALVVSSGIGLQTYTISYLARDKDFTKGIADHLDLLRKMAQQTKKPVVLWLAKSQRGEFVITDVSIEEVRHTRDGWVTVADVSFTLKKASTSTVNVGPIKPTRNPKPNQSQSPTR